MIIGVHKNVIRIPSPRLPENAFPHLGSLNSLQIPTLPLIGQIDMEDGTRNCI